MVTDSTSDSVSDDDAPSPRRTRRQRRAGSSSASIGRLVVNPVVRVGLIVLSTAAVAALAAAVVGPKRMEREVYRPLRDAIEPQVDKLAAEAGALRDQVTEIFERTAPESRKRLARTIEGWIGHFRGD
jgi:hypothetical protein